MQIRILFTTGALALTACQRQEAAPLSSPPSEHQAELTGRKAIAWTECMLSFLAQTQPTRDELREWVRTDDTSSIRARAPE